MFVCEFVHVSEIDGPLSRLIPVSASTWLQHPHLHRVNMYSQVYILSGSPQKKAFDSIKAAR